MRPLVSFGPIRIVFLLAQWSFSKINFAVFFISVSSTSCWLELHPFERSRLLRRSLQNGARFSSSGVTAAFTIAFMFLVGFRLFTCDVGLSVHAVVWDESVFVMHAYSFSFRAF